MAEKPQETEKQVDIEVIEATSDPPVQVKKQNNVKKRKKGENVRRWFKRIKPSF